MILNKIYSEPLGLFQTVEFKNGVNFIFAKKEKSSDAKKSLNGVGKSLFLNFLDYALLSSETKHIKSAKKNNDYIKEYSIVLEFSLNNKGYIIKRSLKNVNTDIIIREQNKLITFESIKEAKEYLCDLIFQNKNYAGKYDNSWLRKLLPFFIKKQEDPKTAVKFLDPIKYASLNMPEMELLPYHLFFLGIDNSLFWTNYNITSDLKEKTKIMKGNKDFITNTYNLKDIPQAENRIDRLKLEIKQYEVNIKKFKLAEQYKDVEKEANNLTLQIKELWYQNHMGTGKIKSYEESYKLGDDIETVKIKNLYKEANELLANNIKRTLDEAVQFRKNIAESRKDFLASEIVNTKHEIETRMSKIEDLELERSKLFGFLEAKSAIQDLSEAYLQLSDKKNQLNDLESKIKIYQDLREQVGKQDLEVKKINLDITSFINDVKDKISVFRNVFFDVHNAIYPENSNREDVGFSLVKNDRSDSKVDIGVSLPSELSTGKNNAKTLIYDISVLLHAIDNKINIPRFLIHDGVFDHMDKSHFIALYEYLQNLARTKKFQYILTFNEEGTLNDKFGDSDMLNPGKIEEEAILILTPGNKLLKNNW